MKPVYTRMPVGCMQWSENAKTPCARMMAVMATILEQPETEPRMKKNEMVQLDYRNKGKVKAFVRTHMKPVYMRMPVGCMQWSEKAKTQCARMMAVMIGPEGASPRWYCEHFGLSFLNSAYIELNSDEGQS